MTSRRVALALVGTVCSVLPCASSANDDPGRPTFTEAEIRVILSLGPWGTYAPPDPTNRVSGNHEAIELGTRLFFDPRLSGQGTVSCSSCHIPDRHWTDNRRRGVGMTEVDRNTPPVINVHAQRWFGWGGAADSLWSQSLRPIVDPRELGATQRHVAELVRNDEQLACRYRKAFGSAPSPTDDEAVFVGVGKSLAAFQETLMSGMTPFDWFRIALEKRERQPASMIYSDAAQRGLKLFIGKGGCASCHSGPNFTNGEFFATGLSKFQPAGRPDPGREAGVKQLLDSRFNLLGKYNDDTTGASAERTRKLATGNARFGEFKVPSLRNLILSSPYGRDGQIDSLAEVVKHYNGLDPVALHARDGRPANPIHLSQREQTDLVVFLESLSTFSNPWRPEDAGHCR
jgi:cytochrome c peroxidase